MTKSWNIDLLLPEARNLYQSIEAHFDFKVYHRLPIRRYCQNADDLKRCARRRRNPRYANVLGDYSEPGEGPNAITDPHGSFEILEGGYVDLPKLIRRMQDYFRNESRLSDHHFDYNELKHTENIWRYSTIEAGHVVFCEGTGIQKNPWFRKLPLTPVKGETLILRSKSLNLPPSIYHSTKWLLPYESERFRIGATYDEADVSPSPTSVARNELIEAARTILREDHAFEVEAHLAGLRPSTPDARPFIGEHPSEKGLFVFNGLGSKGASVAPEMSRQLIAHIFDAADLDPQIDCARFNQQTDQNYATDKDRPSTS